MKYLKVWTSFRDVMKPLKDDEKGRLFDMMLNYAETGEEPGNIAGNERYTWPAAKQWIDLTYAESVRLTENGKKGGRPKTKQNQPEPIKTNENQSEPNKSHKVKESNIRENKVKEPENIVPLKRFIPPTVDDVALYCYERKNHVNAQKFFDYYSSNGWKVGKNPMKDWKAAVRTWERSEITERDYQYERETSGLPY